MSEVSGYQPEPPLAAGPAAQEAGEARAQQPDAPPVLRHLSAVSRAMHQMLAACLADASTPEVEHVHQLRTGTRRVEATLEMLARETGSRGLSVAAERARQRWLRQLKKVRQAAGAVRDLDVHRDLLGEHYLPHGRPAKDRVGQQLDVAATTAHEEPPLVARAYGLDRWLAAARALAADELRHALRRRDAKLEQAEKDFVSAFAARRSSARVRRRAPAVLALEDYMRLMDAMPHLDAENLHDFRKGAKKARYVAESDGEDDAAAAAIAKAIRRVQDAIGDWHDWLVLATESRQALGADGKVLEADLDGCVERQYQRAQRIAATIGRRLVGEWQAVQPPRRPASSHRRL
jgi:CHAD domain-containing protein